MQPGFGRKGQAGPESWMGGWPPSSPGSGPISASFSLAACGSHSQLSVPAPQLPTLLAGQPTWSNDVTPAASSRQGPPRPSMARLRLRVTPQPSQHSTRPWLGPTSKQRFHQPHAQMWRGLPTYAIPHLAVSSSFGGHTMKHTGSYPLTRDQTDTPCSSSATSWPLGRQGGPGSLVPEPCHLPPCSLGLPSHHASLCPSISFVRSHVCLVIHPRCGLL